MPDELIVTVRDNSEYILERGAHLDYMQANLIERINILVEQHSSLGIPYRGSLQRQRRQARWTSRQFRRLFYSCARRYRDLRLLRQQFSEFLLPRIPQLYLLLSEALSSYDFFGGIIDHYLYQAESLREALGVARRARDGNFASRGVVASLDLTFIEATWQV